MANQKQQPQEKIEVLCSGPQRQADGKYSITIGAKASKGKSPLSGRNVRFYLNHVFVSPVVATDDGGVARTWLPNLTEYPTHVMAELDGTSVCNEKLLKADAPPAKARPDKISAQAHGANGNYVITCDVTDQNRAPLAGVLVVINNRGTTSVIKRMTDKNGRVEVPLDRFRKPFAIVTAKVAGVPAETLMLRGPKRKADTRNNLLSKGMWAAAAIWFLVNCALIGFGPQANVASRLTGGAGVAQVEPPQKGLYAQYRASKLAFEESQRPKQPEAVLMGRIRVYSWVSWFLFILITIPYTVYAYAEEVSVLFADMVYGLRSKQATFADLPDMAPVPPSVSADGAEQTPQKESRWQAFVQKYGGETLRFAIVDFFLEKIYGLFERRMTRGSRR